MGTELIIDAAGCDPSLLRSRAHLERFFGDIIRELDLHPVAEAWHAFGAPGFGVTGLVLLSESHLTIHTFPETGTAALNLYCCRRRPEWPWPPRLAAALGATRVRVRSLSRDSRRAEPARPVPPRS